ncbi:MAG: hypothetical protein Q7R34_04980 [Dehalococcoidia bacterium]|nr:hypothetical protein [Dehalococcoidia bacterium]
MSRHYAQPVAIVVNDKDFPGPDFLVYWKFFNYILRIPPFRLTANLNITYLEALVNPWTGKILSIYIILRYQLARATIIALLDCRL